MKKNSISGEFHLLRTVLGSLLRKPATIGYLGGKLKLDDRCRGLPEYDPTNCIACGLCMKDCPTGALKVENRGTREAKDMHAMLDTGLCIFCGQCADSCNKGCLSLSSQSELSHFDRKGLTKEI